jgi:predicted dehydrogenase
MTKHRPSCTSVRLGILGAGMIATHPGGVLPNLPALGETVELRAITSRSLSTAREVAGRFDIPEVYPSLTTMLADSEVDVVINLTPVAAHTETNLEILEAGRHLISEKPIAATVTDADAIIDTARTRSLLIVAAPPWMIDPRRVFARELVQQGAIGSVAFARSRSSHAGPAAMSWPADPAWFYEKGAGALRDMGVYGITELTGIVGPAKRVMAMSGITRATRLVEGGPFDGTELAVTADDNTLLLIDFGESVFGFVDATFNMRAAVSPSLELFASEGTINLWEPFWATRGQPELEIYRRDGDGSSWAVVDLSSIREAQTRFDMLGRAILVSHFVECLQHNRRPVLSAEHARHTLEVMLAAEQSAFTGCAVEVASSFDFAGSGLQP